MEQTVNPVNQIVLRGTLSGAPAFSHENHGRRFYRFTLDVPRLSGTADTLPVLASEPLLASLEAAEADYVEVSGQIRSFNSRLESGRRLLVSVYADGLRLCGGPPANEAELAGAVCKPPVLRRTPLGREICDVMLAVNRHYRRSDYLPCIFWGRTAHEVARLTVGDRLSLTGRLQSRGYNKVLPGGVERRVAYEVSAITARTASYSNSNAPV